METHTQKGIEKSWGAKKNVERRAKRGKASSGPDEKTLAVERRFIEIASGNKKKIRTLILGATPEIRDLALSMGHETVAVDISPRLTLALTNVMKHKDDSNNIFMVGDWLKLHKFLEKDSFDIVLGDLSVNNLPYNLWDDFFKSLSYVMKKDGCFIPRHPVFNYPTKARTCDEVIQEFRYNNNSVMEMILELGLSTDYVKENYNHKEKTIPWINISKYDKQMKKHLTKEEYSFYFNMATYGKDLVTILVSEREFLKQMRKYFDLKDRKAVGTIGNTYRIPVYVFKNKKNIFSKIFRRPKK